MKTLASILSAAAVSVVLMTSTGAKAGCDSCGPYHMDLSGDNAKAAQTLNESLENAGYLPHTSFSFRWDGDHVAYRIQINPKPIMVGDVPLYSKISKNLSGYIPAKFLGGEQAKHCLNDYNFVMSETGHIYGSPALQSMLPTAISNADEAKRCSEQIDLAYFLSSQSKFAQTAL